MISKEKMKKKAIFALKLLIAIAVSLTFSFLLRYPERKKIADYQDKLSEDRKVVRAYVYLRNPRKNRFEYRFKIGDIKYKGVSRYAQMQPHPEEGDSIWVYYKEDDPNVNIWVGMFE